MNVSVVGFANNAARQLELVPAIVIQINELRGKTGSARPLSLSRPLFPGLGLSSSNASGPALAAIPPLRA
jgi:hypothetical protein